MAEGASKLSEEQIYECLKSLTVPVRMNDLKAPSKEFMVRVFECFIKDLEIDVTGPMLRSWEATKHFEDDLYEESTSLILLAMTVNHITNPLGLDVSLKDIVEPKPKRTKKILNYLLVFWNYYLQKCAHFREIEDTLEDEKKRVENLMIENQSLDDMYHDKLDTLNNMPNEEELNAAVEILEEKEKTLKKESDTISTEYHNLKTKEASLRNDISAADVNIMTTKQRFEELEQLIVSSPEKVGIEIQNIKDKIRIKDFKIKEFENKIKQAENEIALLGEFKIEEEQDRKAVDKLTETINQLGGTVKGIVSSLQKIQEEEDKLKRLQLDVDRKEGLKLHQEQKSAKIVLSYRKQLDILREVLEMNLKEETSLQEKILFFKSAVSEMQNRIDTEAKNIQSVTANRRLAVEKSKERKALYMTRMKEIVTRFKDDCESISENIRKAFPYDLEENTSK